MRKLVLAFDGTWNQPDTTPSDGNTSTNVVKFHDALAAADADGVEQCPKYLSGVGTDWYDRLSGGAFGVGLSEHIRDGYQWLCANYRDGDLIHVVGFSRGAYSARSLVGLVRNCGVIRADAGKDIPQLVAEAYAIYRTRGDGADSAQALSFRREFAREATVHFLGIWDTVGALGIPLESFNWFNASFYRFHDTELSGIVRNAFHALAIDEHRKTYQPTLWDPKEKVGQRMEQVWFAGAHANVGGGYDGNPISDAPLRWMIERARECGLAFRDAQLAALTDDPLAGDVTDSYGEFLGGAYRRLEPRFLRTVGGCVHGNEQIHPSFVRRLRGATGYSPRNPVGNCLAGEILPTGRIDRC